MSDLERIVSAADRIESAAHRMAILFEDGYGGNGVRLLEVMETDVVALRAKLQAAEAALRWLSMELGNPAVEGETLEMALVHEAASRILRAESRAEAAEAERDEIKERFGWTYCAYCGDRFPADAPESVERIAEHIHECVKHPIGKIVKENTALQAELALLYDAPEQIRHAHAEIDRLEAEVARLREVLEQIMSKPDHGLVDMEDVHEIARAALEVKP